MSVTVYAKPACVQCNITCRALAIAGIEYAVVQHRQTPREHVMNSGYLQAPVVVARDGHWAAWRPGRIKGLVERAVSAAELMEDAL
ncbi:glutaredoxin family protein [Rhodococcus cerastii]|nr:glutaredoxin family protein [Rhodococcus cerastii]